MLTKNRFHKKYVKVLHNVALALDCDDYEVRSNRGGPGIMGEVVLHTPTLYVEVSGFSVHGCNVMYRSCRGKTDYVGGLNRWMKLDTLDHDRPQALRNFREAMAAAGKEPRYPTTLQYLA